MDKMYNNERQLCAIASHKNVSSSKVVANFFTNLLSYGIAGRVTNDFKLILTDKNLYVEAKSYSTWGGIPETLYTDKHSINDIEYCKIVIEDSDEIIEISVKNEKPMIFIRNNDKNDNLATEMAKLLNYYKDL